MQGEDDQEGFLEELADIILRTLSLANGFTDDFETIVVTKLLKNQRRDYKHGGKRV